MAKQTKNPFLDWDMTKLTDMQKLSESFAVPGVDAQVLMDTQRKNIETLTAANRTAYEGAQAIADSFSIRREALQRKVCCTTTIAGGRATLRALEHEHDYTVHSLQQIHRGLDT